LLINLRRFVAGADVFAILLVWADDQCNRLAVCRLDSDAPTGNTNPS